MIATTTATTVAPDITQQIAEARARSAQRQAQQEASRRRTAAKYRQQVIDGAKTWLPEWALEYIGDIKGGVYIGDIKGGVEDGAIIRLDLPGCSPMKIETYVEIDSPRCFIVSEPVSVQHFPGHGWAVVTADHIIPGYNGKDSLDEAIDLAASYGESWHEMQTAADRRNAEGRQPPPAEPTALQAAQEALNCARLAWENPMNSHHETLICAVFAIAEQLNLLNDNLAKLGR